MSGPRRLVTPARMEHLDELVEFTAACLRDAPADAKLLHDVRVAVSEVCANVVEHGYPAEQAGSIAIETTVTADCLVVRIEDDAPVFDPSVLAPPDTGSDWKHRKPGKLGWHLVYRLMDDVRHEPRGDRGNVVTLTKRLGPPASAPDTG